MAQSNTGKTGVIIQNIKLFIEGVQVPYENITINQGVGTLPTATLVVPPYAGLMDIARFYQPKVHVFFEERQGPVNDLSADDAKKREKLLFTGHIQGVSYSKSTQGLGQIYIMFNCVHKNQLIAECLIDYTGWIKEELNIAGDTLKDGLGNSQAAIIEALQGIDFVGPTNEITPEDSALENPKGKTNVLPEKFGKYASRYIGMPGILANYWNQLNRAAYNKNVRQFHEGFVRLYKPLIEDGLKFFDRISGHRLVEYENQKGKVDPCLSTGTSAGQQVIVPPSNRLFLQSSIQAQMTVANLQNYLQASNEVTNIYAIFTSFYESVDYEMITLASPAEVPLFGLEASAQGERITTEETVENVDSNKNTETAAIETIVKPKTPFYFSPTCNVLFPHMYDTISVNYDESNIPTRIDMVNHEMPQSSSWGTHFRSPHSVRSAIAQAAAAFDKANPNTLFSTITSSFGAIGLYEQGRGIKIEYNAFPRWLSYFSNSNYSASGNDSQTYPEEGTDAYTALQDLQAGWEKRYPDKKDLAMCPWAKEANVSAHQRVLFASADYYYSMLFARSKAGNVSALFNPYIVPGYPMDILEKSPVLPSFHAMCTSVSHIISSNGLRTNISFAAATTYSELANYYMPFILPSLQVSLKLARNPTLVNSDPEAIELASTFYHEVLGVGAAIPEQIYDFSTGLGLPIKLDAAGLWTAGSPDPIATPNGGELNQALTYEGNMELVARPIENRFLFEERFGVKFIDLIQENYSPTVIKYTDNVKESSQQLEIGASQFLDYSTKFGESTSG